MVLLSTMYILGMYILFHSNNAFVTYAANNTEVTNQGGSASTTQNTMATTQSNMQTTEQALVQYQITYVLDGGVNHADNPKTYTIKDENIKLQEPSKTGYVFAGWYEDAKFTKKITEINGERECDLILYAKYEVVTYDIMYQLYGGTLQSGYTNSYTIKSEKIYLPVPVREGYVFEGWYDNIQMAGAPCSSILKGSYGARTYYAKWKLEEYSIIYDLVGGTQNSKNPVSYTYLSGTLSLQAPTRKGYTFSGWYEGQNKVTKIDLGSTGNRIFSAKWKKVSVGKVGKVKLKQTGDFLVISYPKVSLAKGYQISFYEKGKKQKGKTVCLQKLKYTLLKCKKKTTYCVKVRAYGFDSANQRVYGKYSKVYKCKMKEGNP